VARLDFQLVTYKRPPSEANQELADWLGREGYPTTPREIRTWRARGWVAKTIVEPQGYARPTKTRNPPESFDQALSFATVKGGKRMDPVVVPLALQVRGFPVSEELVRGAWATFFDRFSEDVEKVAGPDADPLAAGEQLAEAVAKAADKSRNGRFMRRRAKSLSASPEQLMASAMTVVFTGLLGGSVQPFSAPDAIEETSALDELHRITGLSGFVDDKVEGVGSIAPSHQELRADNVNVFEYFNLDEIRRVSQTASLEGLKMGQERWTIMYRFMTSVAQVTQLTSGPDSAYGMSFTTTIRDDDFTTAFIGLLIVMLEGSDLR
jgi:hypothetical protein